MSVVGRALAWVGVTSYALLIVNEPLRSITHTMRAEGASDAWVWAWLVLLYVPLHVCAGTAAGARARTVAAHKHLIARVGDGVNSLRVA